MKYSYITDVGKKRTNNEDAMFVCNDNENASIYIVADGMGGHNAGEIASSNVIKITSSLLCEKEIITIEDIIKAIQTANKEIYKMSKNDLELKGMGTTIVIAVVKDDQLTIAHVGDSRAYLIAGKEIKRLTTDHSWVQELISTGALSQSEAKDHPQKNVITRAVGISRDVKVDVLQQSWEKGDKLLLCTDGLNTHLEDNEIYNIVNKSDTEIAAEELIKAANDQGGSDNITVVLVENNASEGISND